MSNGSDLTPDPSAMEEMKPCPKCGCPGELELDSNGCAEASWIECHWCEFRFQKRCDEETLVERWNRLSRKKMPVFVEEDEVCDE